jgi:cytochrome c oxidase subunit IV
MAGNHNSGHDTHAHTHHIIPMKVYLTVFGTLLAMTLITVWAATMDFGVMNTPVALLIATFKAALVLMFFMHLKYDNMMNRVIVAIALFFVFLLFLFSGLDIYTRIMQQSTL